MARRKNDWYPTPEWATEELLKHVPLSGVLFECCVGDGVMARVLERRGKVFTNDIDPARDSWFQLDAAACDSWAKHFVQIGADWVVTNPPFNVAPQIVPLAYEYARTGIAMLLRLSYLEPTEDRGAWLNAYPPTKLIVLPRISFTGNGKTDNVTVAWMVWDKGTAQAAPVPAIIIAPNLRFVGAISGDNNATQQEGLFS